MSDLISRDALIEKLKKSIKWCEDDLGSSTASFQSGCIAAIKDIINTVKMEETYPSVDAVKVVHGRWDEERFAFCNVCSNCGLVIDRTSIKMHSGKFNYCPNCGAKMDEVSE